MSLTRVIVYSKVKYRDGEMKNRKEQEFATTKYIFRTEFLKSHERNRLFRFIIKMAFDDSN